MKQRQVEEFKLKVGEKKHEGKKREGGGVEEGARLWERL